MATVVLTAVGTLIGGPIGGAIGAALGQRIDGAIFGSGKAREGPRLKELQLQTSSYGTQIPAIFGAMRVAGTVIWSTDLIEKRSKSGGGKGRPSTVNYSYSASFAVALSSRPVERIGRIWADGNLLRGAADDFKVETGFRFHAGHDDQPLDPLLASAETSGECPAYRGLAYAVFEDMQLADFGNRIPSLTFEIFERGSAVGVIDIARYASAGLIEGQSDAVLAGYAVQGSGAKVALEPLAQSLPISFRPSGDRISIQDWDAPLAPIDGNDAAIADGKTALDRPGRSRSSNGKAPATVSIRHYDPTRDFQAGVQSSRRLGTGRGELQLDLPASVDAGRSRNFAELQLLQRNHALNTASRSLPYGPNGLSVGQAIALGDAGSAMRIVEIEYLRGSSNVVAVEWPSHFAGSTVADPGRNLPDADLAIGQTRLMLVDLPAFGAEDAGRAIAAVAAAGTQPGWRRAALSLVDGERQVDLGGTNGVATIGALVGSLGQHSPLLVDQNNEPVIRVLHDSMALPVGNGDALSFDAPAIWVGGEIIRYGFADKIAPCDYRLRNLLRGCFGTGELPGLHADGSEAFLLDPQSLLTLDGSLVTVGASVTIEALGVGDTAPVGRTLAVVGNAIKPRAPVHGRIERAGNGDLALAWVRRDRLVNSWADGADMPNSENMTEYAIDLLMAGLPVRAWVATMENLVVAASDLASLGVTSGTTINFSISQQGRFARSTPLYLSTIY